MVIITGISTGIGHALANYFLSQGFSVLGIGRNNTITHSNFHFISCDLSDSNQTQHIQLPDLSTQDELIFIHNAGILGEVDYFSQTPIASLEKVMQVNFTAGTHLIQKLLTASIPQKSTFIFISSGAGKSAIPGWAAYCSSKAAVNMFCETLHYEFKEQQMHYRVYAVAPGVVDTNMQTEIRQVPKTKFNAVDKFIEYKELNTLYKPEEICFKLMRLLELNPDIPIQTLRDY